MMLNFEKEVLLLFKEGKDREAEEGNRGYPGPLHPGGGELPKGVPKKLGQADSENWSLSPT
jgi:hypothetical protein